MAGCSAGEILFILAALALSWNPPLSFAPYGWYAKEKEKIIAQASYWHQEAKGDRKGRKEEASHR